MSLLGIVLVGALSIGGYKYFKEKDFRTKVNGEAKKAGEFTKENAKKAGETIKDKAEKLKQKWDEKKQNKS